MAKYRRSVGGVSDFNPTSSRQNDSKKRMNTKTRFQETIMQGVRATGVNAKCGLSRTLDDLKLLAPGLRIL